MEILKSRIMAKINFKHAKYVLPMIVLPFIFIFFYVFNSWGSSSKKTIPIVQTDSIRNINGDEINSDIPGVSKDVAQGDIKDRFQSLREAYKHDKDFSAVSTLDEEERKASGYSSSYSKEDIENIKTNEELDKLTGSLDSNKANLDRKMNKMISEAHRSVNHAKYNRSEKTPEEIYNAAQLERSASYPGHTTNERSINSTIPKPKDEMTVFREQMSIVDSMQRASVSAGHSNSPETTKNKKFGPSADTTFKPLPVSTASKRSTGFNTIRPFQTSESIKAIIDDAEKVSAGTRLRIRLLQEIAVGNHVIPEGTYVFGFVTGFQTQRINISINQIMFDGEPLPVNLDVFDNDGYLGIYVPQSNFLEFSKELGTQGTSGLSSVEMSSGKQTATSSLISKLFTTTGNSINKLIRKNKAFVKYNYIIYLKEKTSNNQ